MRLEHLREDELDALLVGDEEYGQAAEHAASCLSCRRRVGELRRALRADDELDPSLATRARVRQAALAAWAMPQPARRPVWWWAVAAGLVAALALPLLQSGQPDSADVDAAEVLSQVDTLLAGDPVSAAFPAELVTALAAGQEVAARGDAS